MNLEDWLENPSSRRLLMALGISFALHVGVALGFEVSSRGGSTESSVDPVQIERLVADGSQERPGVGNASFNSQARPHILGANEFNNLDAGVPVQKQNVPVVPPAGGQTQGSNRPPVMTQGPKSETVGDFDFPVYPDSQPRRPNGNTGSGNNSGRESGAGRQTEQPPRQDSGERPGETEQAASQGSQSRTAGGTDLPRSRGPNRNASVVLVIEPEVRASMVGGNVQNSVEVEVEVKANGSHTEKIIRGSGSAEVDRLVLDAMKQWKWDPAAREGNLIDSVTSFKYRFNPK